MNLSEKYDLLNRAIVRVHGVMRWGGVFKCSDDTRRLSCSNSLRRKRPRMRLETGKVEKSAIVLTRVARSSPQRRRPISPRAINTNNRRNSPPSYLDEWPQESPTALCPVRSCVAHNYCTWKMCMIQLQCTLFYNLSLCWRGFAVMSQIYSQPRLESLRWSVEELAVWKYNINN